MNRWQAALVVGVALVALMTWTARTPSDGLLWRSAFVATHAAMSVGLWVLLRSARPSVRAVLVGSVALRVVAFPMPPSLSDDGYRYVWDGLVTVHSHHSPYAHRPSDPELEVFQQESVYALLNSPGYHSVYPPVSQAVFVVSAIAYPAYGWLGSWYVLKLLLIAAEAVGVVAALRVFAPNQVALYAWSPLAVVEIAGQGHTEALVVGALGLVLAGGAGRVPVRSIAATLAGGVKLYPIALLPMAWRRDGWAGLAASLTLLVGMAFVLSVGGATNAMESLQLFLGTLDWFSAPYLSLKALAYPFVGEASGAVASTALAAIAAAVAGGVMMSDDGTARALRLGAAVVVVAAILCVPTLHPWYLVPALFVAPALGSPRWLLWLCASTSVTYLAYVLGPEWRLCILALLWVPTAALALRSVRPRRHRAQHVIDRH